MPKVRQILSVHIGSPKGAAALGSSGKVTAGASVGVTASPSANFPIKVKAREAADCEDNSNPEHGDDDDPEDTPVAPASSVGC